MKFTDWLASTFGTAVILTALIGAFWKVILNHLAASVKHKYDKELETHINELRHNSELVLKDIEAKANERNTRLTGVFEHQRGVIENTYGKLLTLHEAIRRFGFSLSAPTADEALKHFHETINEFEYYFPPKAIYLEKDALENVAEYLRTATSLVQNYRDISQHEKMKHTDHIVKCLNDSYAKVPELENKLDVLFENIIDDFQRMLGLNIQAKAKVQ